MKFWWFILLASLCLGPGKPAWAQFDPAPFKQALDQENLNLVVQWLGNDLSQQVDLKPLATKLQQIKPRLLATVPRQATALNYEAMILQVLQPDKTEQPKVQHLIRHSVDYLNLKPGPAVLALQEVKPATGQRHTPFKIIKGFPAALTGLRPQTPHTIVGLPDYNRRRLGKIALEQAIAQGWPLYLFNSDTPDALAELQQQGFQRFYRIHAFYSNWGKDIIVAQRKAGTALVYTGLFGNMMEDHVLHMLKTTSFQNKQINTTQIQRFYSQGLTTKDKMLQRYAQDLSTLKPEHTILMLGYLNILGQAIAEKQRAWQQCQHHKSSPMPLFALTPTSCAPCPHCPALPSLFEALPGQALELQRFSLRDIHGKTWDLVHVGANHSLYGDMTSDLIRLALQKGVRHIIFAGSAGAVNAKLPIYSWVIPQQVRDYHNHRQPFPNGFLSYHTAATPPEKKHLSFGTFHQGAISPVAETQSQVRTWLTEKVDTVDIEVGEIAREVSQWPEASLSVALLVTDFPGAFLQKQAHHLDQVNYQQKYSVIPTLLNMVLHRYQIATIVPPPPRPTWEPDTPKRHAQAIQSYIPLFSQQAGIDLNILLQAMLYRDQQSQNYWLQRIEHGWQMSFQEHWPDEAFAEVFQLWFYLSWQQHHQGKLPPNIRLQLKAIEHKMRPILDSGHIQIAHTDPQPVFVPFSAQQPTYHVSLADLPEVQGLSVQRSYDYLYRASASEGTVLQHEQWAIDTLLEKPGAQLAATRVWKHYAQGLKQGLSAPQAFAKATAQVEQRLNHQIRTGELAQDLLSVINWDTGFRPEDVLFLSGDYATTALYGSVIFIAKQQRPRGIPLNEYGVKTGFYNRLPYQWLLSPKGIWIFAVADKAEYVLPAYLDHSELVGVDVRAERQFMFKDAKRTGHPGPLLRKYRKQFDPHSKQLWVHILDAQNRWLGTLGSQPLSPGFQPPFPPSTESLPPAIQDYLKVSGHLVTPASL